MTHQPHLFFNVTRHAYIWAGQERGTLKNLSLDRFSPTSALIYLLGTDWVGERIALLGPGNARAAMAEAAWQEIRPESRRRIISSSTPGLVDATADAGRARKDAMDAAQHYSVEAHTPHMVVNFDLNQRLDPAEFGDSTLLAGMACGALTGIPGGTQTALTLLLAGSSHGEASRGDFPIDHELVGAWSGHRLGVLPVASPAAPWALESVTGTVCELLEESGLASYQLNEVGAVERTWASHTE